MISHFYKPLTTEFIKKITSNHKRHSFPSNWKNIVKGTSPAHRITFGFVKK